MRTILSFFALLVCFGMSTPTATAAELDGIWQTRIVPFRIQIESTRDGIRSKRVNETTWNYYTAKSRDRYVDKQGNSYQVTGPNTIEHHDRSTGRRTELTRVNRQRERNRDDDYRTGDHRDRDDGRYDDRNDDRYDDNYQDRNRFAALNGQWFNQRTRHVIAIQAVPNGLRIDRGGDRSVLFAPTRDSKVFRNPRGETITWLNQHTIQLQTRDSKNLIFHRADDTPKRGKGHGNSKAHGHDKTHHHDKSHGHGKAHGHHK